MTQQPHPAPPTAPPAAVYQTCIVFMLGYPAMGKRTIGSHLAALLDGVLVDNQLIYGPWSSCSAGTASRCCRRRSGSASFPSARPCSG